MSDTMETTAPAAEEDGTISIGSERFMRDGAGRLVPIDLVKDTDKIIDQTVRKIMGHADTLSAQIARFRGHSFDDVGALQALLAEKYGARIGGTKGNITLTSYDGLLQVKVQVQDQVAFGAELQVAKELVDECISEWAEGSRSEIRALVEHAFQVDKEGRINRGALFQLRRIAIEDERWQQAMSAIGDSMRIVGSSTYMRFYRRETTSHRWEPVTIDLASA